MNRKRYGAVFGKPKEYYENSRMIGRSLRLRRRKEKPWERKVRLARWAREDKEWEDYLWDDLMSYTSERFDSRTMDPYSPSY